MRGGEGVELVAFKTARWREGSSLGQMRFTVVGMSRHRTRMKPVIIDGGHSLGALLFASCLEVCIFTIKHPQMKKVLLFVVLGFVGAAMSVHAQKVFSVNYSSQADVKVFVVDYESQADLCVHRVDYASQATGNSGAWFWVDYESQADKKIFFVDYESQADLKIYFVDYPSQSKWKNRGKMHLMF